MDDPSEDISKAVEILKKLEPGKLPLPLFLEVARLTVTPILEIVPLRKNLQGGVEVLLTQRELDDSNWPGMYHTPGTVIRASDQEGSYTDAFNRILKGELKETETREPIFVRNIFHKVKRGMESSLIFWVEVIGDPRVGEFHNVDNLPDNLIDSQRKFIDLAVNDYLKENQ